MGTFALFIHTEHVASTVSSFCKTLQLLSIHAQAQRDEQFTIHDKSSCVEAIQVGITSARV
jgi:hypothetical protein